MAMTNKTVHTVHLAFPNRGPGKALNACMAVSPVRMVCLPNSSCTATFTIQLTMMTQKVINPARAPRVVVAINSPLPTIDADKIKLGPRNRSCPRKAVGGSLIISGGRI